MWHNRIIISLQHHTLHRKNNESTQEWMGRLRAKAMDVAISRKQQVTDRTIHQWAE